MKTRYFLILPFCLFFTLIMSSQTITGTVLDENNEPVIGAQVLQKGTSHGTGTDENGKFTLKVPALPITLVISFLGYTDKEIEVTSADKPVDVKMETGAIQIAVTQVTGQRVSEKQKASPLTVESLDILGIKQTASDNFYDGLGTLKGVDLTAASLGFKVINMRGFNSTSPVRSLQIIDGVDNQAPGLNFSLGNFLGSCELDVLKVDLIQGASSSFYGPNAFNGVISMETKNPFYQKGLSVAAKYGERNLFETSMRWADAIKNKKGHDFFGYKFSMQYLRADDWVADNYDAVTGTKSPKTNPGGYDAVNIYGDEYQTGNDLSSASPWTFPGVGVWHRTGYKELDLVDYRTRNFKASTAFHFRVKPSLKEESPEFILAGNMGTGTTVYQGDNRFSLRGIAFYQGRIEFRKKDKFFIRAYATQDDAGKSYDPYFAALLLQTNAKTNRDWSTDYLNYWQNNIDPKIKEKGYPQLQFVINPDGSFGTTFDRVAAAKWIADHQADLTSYHEMTRAYADKGNPLNRSLDAYAPGTDRFNQEFDRIRNSYNNQGGTRFYDRSALYHAQGEYKFKPSFADHFTVGGNVRLYTPQSKGTIFYDSSGIKITNFEYGVYSGLDKMTNDKKWNFSATVRMDKNQNFNFVFTPAASVVYNPKQNTYLRASFSSAIRNPTLSDQYLYLNVGRAILAGNLHGVQHLITVPSLLDYVNTLDTKKLKYFDIAGIQPEKVKTFEVGYRSTLFNSLYVDLGYYYSIYNDFLGYNIGVQGTFDAATGFPKALQAYRYAANSTNTVTTQGFSAGLNYFFHNFYQLSGNYSWNKLIKTFADDPIIPAFNTPEHKFNIGISGRDMPIRINGQKLNAFGFNLNYKWIDAFNYEGSPQFSGYIPSYSLLDGQINWLIKSMNTTVKLGGSNLLNNKQFQAYGGPRIGRLAYISLLYEWKKK